MATKRHNKFIPVFEGKTVRASVTGMDDNVVKVKFKKRRKGQSISVAAAAKRARLV